MMGEVVREDDLVALQDKKVAQAAAWTRHRDPDKVAEAREALARIKAQRLRIKADRALLAVGIDPRTFEAEL